ncbi:MAG: DNA polymerase III subunit beta [Hyphomicrobiaceae bacterium]|nr:MAG: DNA polymerase III subunit beta [Hyphomicrobiaceae bacterium]
MNLKLNRSKMLAALQVVGGATASRDLKPILQSIKFVAQPGKIELSATDLEIGLTLTLDAEHDQEGCVIIPPRVQQILRELDDEDVELSTSGDTICIKSASSEFELATDDPSGFPDLPKGDASSWVTLNAELIREAIGRTSFAVASAESSKFGAATGLYLEILDGNAVLVGTDGRRLACWGMIQPKSNLAKTGVIPVKAVSILNRLLVNSDVKVSIGQNDAMFQTENATLYTRLVEGKFPEFRAVLPKESPNRTHLLVSQFAGAVRQASVMADAESRRVVFNFSGDKLTLHASGSTSGRSRVEIPVKVEKPCEIAFDSKFVLDGLKPLDQSSQVSLELNGSDRPAVFRQADRYLYVVVPLVNAN